MKHTQFASGSLLTHYEEDQDEKEATDHHDDCSLSFAQCIPCQRIKTALIQYQHIVDAKRGVDDKNDSRSKPTNTLPAADDHNDSPLRPKTSSSSDSNYGAVQMLNDYHHIILHHGLDDKPSSFDSCFQFMVNTEPGIVCNLYQCPVVRSHFRRRRRYGGPQSTKRTQLTQYEMDDRLDILRQIHSHLVHGPDTTMLTERERMDIEEETEMMDKEERNEKVIQLVADKMRQKTKSIEQIVADGAVLVDRQKSSTSNFFRKRQSSKFVTFNLGDDFDDLKDGEFEFESENQEDSEEQKHSDFNEVEIQQDEHEILDEFCNVTGCDPALAVSFLKDSDWNLTTATNQYFDISGDPTQIASFQESANAHHDAVDDGVYTEGIRFWYWKRDETMPSTAMPVDRRYQSLKEEMVDSGLVPLENWTDLIAKCKVFLETQFVREMSANGVGQDVYGIMAGSAFTLQLLLALKLYTDFDDLNANFCAHFRLKKLSKYEFESIRNLVHRNGKFWNMAKLLIECVQCFGKLLVNKRKRFYRGISKEFNLKRLVARFHVPLSTSTSFLEASHFAENGIVLALGRHETEVPCFDAHLISCFHHEKEVIFFGGDSILHIRDIQKWDKGLRKWRSYITELKAIQSIRTLANGLIPTLHGRSSWKVRDMMHQMLSSILDPNDSSPTSSSYVNQLLKFQIRNAPNRIVYDLEMLRKEGDYLHPLFVKNSDLQRLNFVNLCKVFPRATEIVIDLPSFFKMSNLFLKSMLEDLPKIGKNVEIHMQWMADSTAGMDANVACIERYRVNLDTLGVDTQYTSRSVIFSVLDIGSSESKSEENVLPRQVILKMQASISVAEDLRLRTMPLIRGYVLDVNRSHFRQTSIISFRSDRDQGSWLRVPADVMLIIFKYCGKIEYYPKVRDHDYEFKLMLLGDFGVGKSQLLKRFGFVQESYDEMLLPYSTRTVLTETKTVNLEVWDTVESSHLHQVDAFILVYDVTNYESFANIEDIWMEKLRREEIMKDVPKVLVGNKADNEKYRDVKEEEAMEYAESHYMLFFETSAIYDVNVDEAFLSVNSQLIERAERDWDLMISQGGSCCKCAVL